MKWSYKVLAIADFHMSNRLPYARPTKRDQTDRLEDQLALWDQVKQVAIAEEIETILVLGDLFDKSLIDAVTLTHTVSAIIGLGTEVLILPGNHDANSIRGGRFTVEAFGAMGHDRIQVIGEQSGQRVEVGQLVFHPVAFKPSLAAMEEIRFIQAGLDSSRYNVLLLHASILGARHMGWECDDGLDPDAVCSGFDLVLAGHFHAHQLFGSCGMYLGAPMHHHYGDVGRSAGFWLFEFGRKGLRNKTFIESNAPKFHLCKSLKENHDAGPGDYLRYELEATHARWAKIKPKAQAHCEALRATGVKADFKHKPVYHHESRLVAASGISIGLSMESALVEYTKASGVKTAGLDSKRLKTMGLDALALARTFHGVD